jgi:hypothetical protein
MAVEESTAQLGTRNKFSGTHTWYARAEKAREGIKACPDVALQNLPILAPYFNA